MHHSLCLSCYIFDQKLVSLKMYALSSLGLIFRHNKTRSHLKRPRFTQTHESFISEGGREWETNVCKNHGLKFLSHTCSRMRTNIFIFLPHLGIEWQVAVLYIKKHLIVINMSDNKSTRGKSLTWHDLRAYIRTRDIFQC